VIGYLFFDFSEEMKSILFFFVIDNEVSDIMSKMGCCLRSEGQDD
jgi:hypothetical protein